VANLILTVTRRCNLRCSYCPTAKEGWPSLTPADVRRAFALFVDQYGGGDVKIFGGEPLLVPEVVDEALACASRLEGVRRIYLSTNGLGLDESGLERLAAHPKLVLTISLDGTGEHNRRLRRALPGVADAYDHLMTLRPLLTRFPRLVVTQTIAPSSASAMVENFRHLSACGFRSFNFLPAYYVCWRGEQLAALRDGFSGVAAHITGRWRTGERLYVRNLFTWAPAPFFNAGLIVDADRSIHSSNVGLAGALDELRSLTRLGDLDIPPDAQLLWQQASRTRELLANRVPPAVWRSTLAVDAALTAFCRVLYPAYAEHYKRRHAA
jgi:sulfatase maturation enzyme AslB (radical SAM superfamily)